MGVTQYFGSAKPPFLKLSLFFEGKAKQNKKPTFEYLKAKRSVEESENLTRIILILFKLNLWAKSISFVLPKL